MASPAAVLAILVTANTKDAVAGLSNVQRHLGDAERKSDRFARQSSLHARVSSRGFSGIAVAARGATAGIGGLAVGAGFLVKQFEESHKIAKQTDAVLKSTGHAANVSAGHVDKLATALSRKTGIDDETIKSGENLLLTFTKIRNETGKGNKIFDQATRVVTDMSVALGQDTKSSAIQLGKALNDPIKGVTALQRVGVSFTAKQKEHIKTLEETGHHLGAQKLILRELNREFAGSAAAQATPFAKLKVEAGNLAETLGSKLAPFAAGAATAVNNFLVQMQTGEGTGGRFLATVKGIASGISGFVSSATTAVSQFVARNRESIRQLGQAFENIGKAIRFVIEKVLLPVIMRALPGIRQAFQGIIRIAQGLIAFFTGVFTGDFGKMWDGIKTIASGALKLLGGVIRAGTAPLREAGSKIGEAISAGFHKALSAVVGIARGLINTIIDIINILPGVHIKHIGGGGGPKPTSVTLRPPAGGQSARPRGFAEGGKVSMPVAIMGEEAPRHPEWVIPTNPAYRKRAIGLWMSTARDIGIPGFALGGDIGSALSGAAGSVGGALLGPTIGTQAGLSAGKLLAKLPRNPFTGPFTGIGKFALRKAAAIIKDKASALLGSGGGDSSGAGNAGDTLAFAHDVASRFGLRISSTYRSPAHNAAVGGVPNSLHTHGSFSHPGATDLVGDPANYGPASNYARAKYHPREVLIHDVGSGLHLHLGWFRKGGKFARGGLANYNHVFPRHGLGDAGGHTQLTPDVVRSIAASAGLPTAAFEQIAHGESSYYPGIVSSDGGYGLWQMTPRVWGPAAKKHLASLGGIGQMLNPVKNALMARYLYARSGLSPWFGTKYLTASARKSAGPLGKVQRTVKSGRKGAGRHGTGVFPSAFRPGGGHSNFVSGTGGKGGGFALQDISKGTGIPLQAGLPAGSSDAGASDAGSGEDPNQPLIDAMNAATAAEQAHTDALNAVKDEMRRQNDFATSVANVTSFQAVKALADLISGHIVGVGYAGRALSASDGSTSRY